MMNRHVKAFSEKHPIIYGLISSVVGASTGIGGFALASEQGVTNALYSGLLFTIGFTLIGSGIVHAFASPSFISKWIDPKSPTKLWKTLIIAASLGLVSAAFCLAIYIQKQPQ